MTRDINPIVEIGGCLWVIEGWEDLNESSKAAFPPLLKLHRLVRREEKICAERYLDVWMEVPIRAATHGECFPAMLG